MAYNFGDLKKKINEVEKWFGHELSGVRTGQATPALLDGISVEAYSSRMPIRDIASISVEDARSLRVVPFDLTQIKAIEKAIAASNLGVSSSTDEKGLRVHFPELTTERRTMLLKLTREKLEEARITLRGERDRIWNDIQKIEKGGKISEDEKFRNKEEMQKIINGGNDKLNEIALKKEKEIQG